MPESRQQRIDLASTCARGIRLLRGKAAWRLFDRHGHNSCDKQGGNRKRNKTGLPCRVLIAAAYSKQSLASRSLHAASAEMITQRAGERGKTIIHINVVHRVIMIFIFLTQDTEGRETEEQPPGSPGSRV